jgi:hypothetical protein
MTNSQIIRDNSLLWLQPRGFQVASSLPLSGGHFDQLRPIEEVAARALAIKGLFAWVVAPETALPGAILTRFLGDNDLADDLTGDEREILLLDRTAARRAHQNTIGWKLENLWPLAWVLGFEPQPTVEAEHITEEIQHALLHEFLPSFETGIEEFRAQVVPRSSSEVAALEDLFYCAHNAVRSAQLGGATVPEGFDPIAHGGAVHERRHALTWCLSPGTGWEDTDLST